MVFQSTPLETPTPTVTPTPTPTPSEPGVTTATFEGVTDGDTIRTSVGTVRIIGIDAPEQGECGHEEASRVIGNLLSPGDTVRLQLPPGQNDRDRHERLLRYVFTPGGVDLGLLQLETGQAIARYDSTDGYPAHPHEDAYHAAQIATRGPNGAVLTTACQRAPSPTPTPSPTTIDAPTLVDAPESPDATTPWWQQYSSCAQLKRNKAGHPKGPFRKNHPKEGDIYDWFANGTGHRGDGDGDGLACE